MGISYIWYLVKGFRGYYATKIYDDIGWYPKINLEVGISYLFWIEEFSKNSYQNWENLSNKEKRGI